MHSEIQRERAEIGGMMARPEYREWNPELIKPKKLLNPVKASRSHQELHRELLANHRRGLGVDSKPELQRVLEHRRRNQLIKKKKEELEAKRLQCPFEQELLRRQQRLNQVGARYPAPARASSQATCCLLAQGRTLHVATAGGREEVKQKEHWTRSLPLSRVFTVHSLCYVALGKWLPLSEPWFSHQPSVLHTDSVSFSQLPSEPDGISFLEAGSLSPDEVNDVN
ncbi:actin-associated protein FAM107A isoform X1 [Loxodonta africana]|uniref:actin-associated protein FAM107A isoform X1 n=1 Tax=Loxodonta africana TaxID=9785 RepID=UPI000C813A55|nr:protein FAM107A isoform X2 [Loxodonta africana]